MHLRNRQSYQGLYQLIIAILPLQATVIEKHRRSHEGEQTFFTSRPLMLLKALLLQAQVTGRVGATDPAHSVLEAAQVTPCLQDTFQRKLALCSAEANYICKHRFLSGIIWPSWVFCFNCQKQRTARMVTLLYQQRGCQFPPLFGHRKTMHEMSSDSTLLASRQQLLKDVLESCGSKKSGREGGLEKKSSQTVDQRREGKHVFLSKLCLYKHQTHSFYFMV